MIFYTTSETVLIESIIVYSIGIYTTLIYLARLFISWSFIWIDLEWDAPELLPIWFLNTAETWVEIEEEGKLKMHQAIHNQIWKLNVLNLFYVQQPHS